MSKKVYLPTYLEMLHRLQLAFLTKGQRKVGYTCLMFEKLLTDMYWDRREDKDYSRLLVATAHGLKEQFNYALERFCKQEGLFHFDVQEYGFSNKDHEGYLIRVRFIQQAIEWEEKRQVKQ